MAKDGETGKEDNESSGSREPLPDVNPSLISEKLPDEDAPPSVSVPTSKPRRDSLKRQKIKNYKANRRLRKRYADKAYELARGSLVFWGVAISVIGIVFGVTGRQMLSDKVIIIATTSVTVNVLAAFLGVIRGLFPSRVEEKKQKN